MATPRILASLMVGALLLGSRGSRASPPPDHSTPSDPSRATTVRDGDEYSFDVPRRARPCIVFPASMFESANCPPDARPLDTPPPSPERERVIALGIVQAGDQRPAQITVTFNRLKRSFQPDQAVAEAFAAGMMRQIPASIPGGRVRAETSTVGLLAMHGLTVARVAFDVDGASGPYERFQHAVSYSVWGPGGSYTVSLYTANANAPALDALAQEMAATIRLSHPAPPMPPP